MMGLGRAGLLSGLAGLSAWMVGRHDTSARENNCVNQQMCRSCRILQRCGRPEGISARRVITRKADGRQAG